MAGITLTVEAEGVERVISEIGRDYKERAPKFFAEVGTFLRAEFVKSMQSGVDPEGKPLPPPEVWTRIAGIGRGVKAAKAAASGEKLMPLLNTGKMQASLGTVKTTATTLEFGFHGAQKKKATSQLYGIEGKMRVRKNPIGITKKVKVGEKLVGRGKWNYQKTRKDVFEKKTTPIYSGIRTAKAGHEYIRVQNGNKGWITKRVQGGTVNIKPTARRFFYLSPQQQDKIVDMFVNDKAV
jgi:hypothetical protein